MSSSPIPSFASVSNSCDISCTLPKVETWEDLLVMLVKDILGTMDWRFRFVWHLAVLAHWSTCYEKTLPWWFTLLALANDQTALHALHVQFHQSLRDWLYCVQKPNLQEINQIYRLSKAIKKIYQILCNSKLQLLAYLLMTVLWEYQLRCLLYKPFCTRCILS